ncbi:acyl carrier protein [Dactylosporangium darangshiense]|uniref:Acyl carrier protein n=1 Tax=Dactylosporangium darangshiense TaxID=579108 RepID=A0ABP8DEY6_9ACTN
MKTFEEFVGLLQEELGLPITLEQAGGSLDAVPGWDSMHLLTVLVLLERQSSRQISMPAVLEAGSLRDIYDLAAAA